MQAGSIMAPRSCGSKTFGVVCQANVNGNARLMTYQSDRLGPDISRSQSARPTIKSPSRTGMSSAELTADKNCHQHCTFAIRTLIMPLAPPISSGIRPLRSDSGIFMYLASSPIASRCLQSASIPVARLAHPQTSAHL